MRAYAAQFRFIYYPTFPTEIVLLVDLLLNYKIAKAIYKYDEVKTDGL